MLHTQAARAAVHHSTGEMLAQAVQEVDHAMPVKEGVVNADCLEPGFRVHTFAPGEECVR